MSGPPEGQNEYAYWAGALGAALEMALDGRPVSAQVARDILRDYEAWKSALIARLVKA